MLCVFKRDLVSVCIILNLSYISQLIHLDILTLFDKMLVSRVRTLNFFLFWYLVNKGRDCKGVNAIGNVSIVLDLHPQSLMHESFLHVFRPGDNELEECSVSIHCSDLADLDEIVVVDGSLHK